MKTNTSKIVAGLLAIAATACAAKLDVHEWGTFTILAGSDGQPIRWYQPESSVTELPRFVVRPTIFGKGSFALNYTRMETPVLYFYSDSPTAVRAKVDFVGGRITERFPMNAPYSPPQQSNLVAASTVRADTMMWQGELISPTDLVAMGKLPSLTGQPGAHYGHAREVPGAWLFHATSTAPSPELALTGSSAAQPYEKFIFYRGMGDNLPPLTVSAPDNDSVRLIRADEDKSTTVAFALHVDGTKARWTQLPDLKATGWSQEGNAYPTATARFPDAMRPVTEVQNELADALVAALQKEGLSTDEARAMVATWRDVWLREPGTRVLALLPRKWIDQTLPLNINPKPQNVARVFVGRYELFAPAREEKLLALLDQTRVTKPTTSQIDSFRALQLGRFANGALQRAQDLIAKRTDLLFQTIQQQAAQPLQTAALPVR